MKLVVDTNYLRANDLEVFLRRSPENVAVLTDYAAMEAFKTENLATLLKSFEILSRYPRQVLVLKSTTAVCGLNSRNAGLQRRLIDRKQTAAFPLFHSQLREAAAGNVGYAGEIRESGQIAAQHMSVLIDDAVGMTDNFLEMSQRFSLAERRIIRTSDTYTPEIVDKFVQASLELAKELMDIHPRVVRYPANGDVKNHFLTRMAVCMMMLILHWIGDGGELNTKPEKIRNDFVDVNFAAYSLYFDGLLSHDKKLTAIASQARYVLAI